MGTRIEQLERQVEVLRAAILGPTAADFGTRLAAAEAADRIAAEPVEATVPAPTWRPIAEMPKEWRDGRRVIVEDSYGDPWVARHPPSKDDDRRWFCDGGGYISPPVRYLDLTIPEVSRV